MDLTNETTITEFNETQFANGILSDNQDLLVNLARISTEYAQNGDSAAFYILVKAVILTLNLAQSHMKFTLAGMQGTMN